MQKKRTFARRKGGKTDKSDGKLKNLAVPHYCIAVTHELVV